MKKFIALKDNLSRIFLSDKTRINTNSIHLQNQLILIDFYKEDFLTVTIMGITVFYFYNNSKVKPFNDFIDITSNEKYKLKNIICNSLLKTNIIIEGADGIGKSTLVMELAHMGYITQDRAVNEITRKIRKEIPLNERLKSISDYLSYDKYRKVIFLFLSDESILENRINSRENISEFDKRALEFHRLYIDTYFHLRHYENLYLIDCFNKSPLELALEIKSLI